MFFVCVFCFVLFFVFFFVFYFCTYISQFAQKVNDLRSHIVPIYKGCFKMKFKKKI